MPSSRKTTSPSPTIRIELPALHKGQQQVVSQAKRFNVLTMGRRWGKSLLLRYLLTVEALKNRPVAWFSPNNKILADSWREMKAALQPIITEKREDDHRIELMGGGSIEMWSLESEDAGRSRKYAIAVVDESAMVQNLKTFWEENIRPTLTDYRGTAWFASTPKGMNYYKVLFDRGPDPDDKWKDWTSWQMPTVTNPFISPEEVEAARAEMTEAAFNQEYLALFVNWEGSVFRNIENCATAKKQSGPVPGHKYVIGIDWGRSIDYTVFTVIDETDRCVADYDRFSQVDYKLQRDRLRALREKWKPHRIIAESNSIGEPIIEQLGVEGVPVERFVTTNDSKRAAIEHLALAFERQTIRVPNDAVYVAELVGFQGTILPSGMIRYSAPEGGHDDICMSLAVGWTAVTDGFGYGALEYMKENFELVGGKKGEVPKLVAKVETSKEAKPSTSSNTPKCEKCGSACMVKIGSLRRCNQCGSESDSFTPYTRMPNLGNINQFRKGATR